MANGIVELAVVISLAAILGVIARLFKQPVFLAYLIAGILIGVFDVHHLLDKSFFEVLSQIGVMLLLFTIGLEINYSSIRSVGKTSVILGLGQIIFTFVIGFGICLLLSFNSVTAAYIALALTFSSTIIVVKLLSEKKDLHSLYGRLSLGFLLVQDMVAILVLLILSGIHNTGSFSALAAIWLMSKGLLLFVAIIFLGRFALPPLFDRVARSQELLFLISLAWLFLMAALVSRLGFSVEIAGFLAGLALANSSENFEIASRMRPLRDFFLLIFFIYLGSNIVFSSFNGLLWPAIVLTLFVLIGNPLIVMVMMGWMGYRRRTSFLTGVTMAQISEFSFVLAALGVSMGQIGNNVVVLITTIGIVTFIVSSYAILNGDNLARRFHRWLAVFEKIKPSAENGFEDDSLLSRPIVLIGGHRVGQGIASQLNKDDLLIVDFDPLVVDKLRAHGFNVLMGDISDVDIAEKANLNLAKLVICTSPEFNDNLRVLKSLKAVNDNIKIVLRAESEKDARMFYKHGADYVLIPQLTAGHAFGSILSDLSNFSKIKSMRQADLKILAKEIVD